MPLEILGMVATQEVSETRGSITERAIDPGFLAEFAQAHEQSGFDRVLIGYGAPSPTASRSPPTCSATPPGSRC